MTAKLISVFCAGALVVGGVFWLDGQPSVAAEPLAAGQPMPIPGAAPTLAPPHGSPTAVTAQPPATNPAPIAGQPLENATPTDPACADESECGGFCGAAVCSPPGKYWLRADYLMWWTSGQRLPPLVTTSPDGTPVSQAGVLGAPGTTILFGGDTVGNDMRSGFRTTLGMWLDDCHKWDLEFDYLSLGERTNSFDMFSTGFPILSRPFFNVQTNRQAAELVAYPGTLEGRVSVEARDYFQSAGVTLSRNLCSCNSCESCDSCEEPCGCSVPSLFCCRTDLLIGFRYYNLSDFVGITEDLRITQEGPTAGTIIGVHDTFRARNDFYGSELGLRTRIYRGRWSMEFLTKIAMGNNHQTITIDGTTTITPPASTTQTYNAGILAGSTNNGVYQRDQFTIIPQLSMELGYQLNCHWRAYIGYDILYWGAVARAGDQIDLNLDPRNFPPATAQGLPFPAFPGKTDSFWAQGLHLGAEYRF